MAKLIKWLTGSEINHVSILYESVDWNSEIVVEATSTGVNCHKFSKEPKYQFIILDEEASKNLSSVISYLGQFYDYIGLIKFGFVLFLWKVFKAKIKHPLTKTKGQLCSELVAQYLKSFKDIEIKNPQWTTPEDLLKICKKNPDLFFRVR